MQAVGGKNKSDCLRKVLNYVMSKELQKCYSWSETKNRKGLQNLSSIVGVIHSAVLVNFHDYKMDWGSKIISNSLKHSGKPEGKKKNVGRSVEGAEENGTVEGGEENDTDVDII